MEQLGEYLLHRMIGEGGMGRVYEAEERLSGRAVAVKLLRTELARIPRVRKLFINEMLILAKLEHPNIVRSLASIEVDDQLAVVLELMDGLSLRELLDERGPLTADEAIHVIACVAKALCAAHGHVPPVIHRDLKPDNIMVNASGAVKVMDFGIAKVLERADQTNTKQVGTLLYMSPEQIDARAIDHRSDLYALGLVFYELLTGSPPFVADSHRELLNQQCTALPPPLPDAVRDQLPPECEEVLFAMLEKKPSRRPQSAMRVLERLGERVLTSRPPSSRRAPLADTDLMGPPRPSQTVQMAPLSQTPADPHPSGTDTTLPGQPPDGHDSWHASNARAAWLARFEGLEGRTLVPGGSGKPSSTTVAQPPTMVRVAATQSGELELSGRMSLVVIAALTITAGMITYVIRAL